MVVPLVILKIHFSGQLLQLQINQIKMIIVIIKFTLNTKKKRVLSHNKIYNIENKKIYFNFGSEHFINLYKSKKNKVVRNQIAYIMQSNNNLFFNYSENQNDPYKLFLQRNNFLEKIKNHKNLKISISSPENNFDTVAEKKIINELLIQKNYFYIK